MIPTPSMITWVWGFTLMSAPPMIALIVMVTSRAANCARRRSRSAPPMNATTVRCCGTTQTPLRVRPLRIARWRSSAGPGTTGDGDGAAAGRMGTLVVGAAGRSRVIGTRSA